MTVSASFLSARGLPSAAADGLRRFVITLLLTCVGLGLLPAQRAAADAIDGLGRCEDAERPGLLEDIDTPQVALRTQSAYTLLGGGIALDVQIRGASAASQIRVEAFPAVRTVETLTGFTDGKPLRSDAFWIHQYRVSDLPISEDGLAQIINIPLGYDGPTSAPVVDPGNYPLQVTLLDGAGSAKDSFTTLMVVAEDRQAAATVAPIVTIESEPGLLPNGDLNSVFIEDFEGNGRLNDLLSSLMTYPNVGVTLMPNPETVDSINRSSTKSFAEGQAALPLSLGAMRSLATRPQTEVIPTSFAPIDLAGVVHEARAHAELQLDMGYATVTNAWAKSPNGTTYMVDYVTPELISFLAARGVNRIISTPDDWVLPGDDRAVPEPGIAAISPDAVASDQVVDQTADAAEDASDTAAQADVPEVKAVILDPVPNQLLSACTSDSARVQALMGYFNLRRDSAKPIAFATPPRWEASKGLISELLAAMDVAPFVNAVTVATASQREPVQTVEPATDEALGVPMGRAAASEASLTIASLYDALPDDQARALMTRNLLIAESRRWEDADGGTMQTAYYWGATAPRQEFTAAIRAPENQDIRLTSQEATIPISIRNDFNVPVFVRITLESPRIEVLDQGQDLVELSPGLNVRNFRVTARGSGNAPLQVLITSPDGRIVFADSNITIRSTVMSGVAWMITVVALAFLVVWWLRSVLLRRNAQAPLDQDVTHQSHELDLLDESVFDESVIDRYEDPYNPYEDPYDDAFADTPDVWVTGELDPALMPIGAADRDDSSEDGAPDEGSWTADPDDRYPTPRNTADTSWRSEDPALTRAQRRRRPDAASPPAARDAGATESVDRAESEADSEPQIPPATPGISSTRRKRADRSAPPVRKAGSRRGADNSAPLSREGVQREGSGYSSDRKGRRHRPYHSDRAQSAPRPPVQPPKQGDK